MNPQLQPVMFSFLDDCLVGSCLQSITTSSAMATSLRSSLILDQLYWPSQCSREQITFSSGVISLQTNLMILCFKRPSLLRLTRRSTCADPRINLKSHTYHRRYLLSRYLADWLILYSDTCQSSSTNLQIRLIINVGRSSLVPSQSPTFLGAFPQPGRLMWPHQSGICSNIPYSVNSPSQGLTLSFWIYGQS